MKLTASLFGLDPKIAAADLTKVAHLFEAGNIVSDITGDMFRVRAKVAGPDGFTFKLANLQGKSVPTPSNFYPVNRYVAKLARWARFVIAYNKDWDMYVKEYIRAAGLPVDESYNWAQYFQWKYVPQLHGDDEVKDEAIHQTIITALAHRKALDANNPHGFQHVIKRFPPAVQELPLEKQVTQFLLTLFKGRVQEANLFIDKMQNPDDVSISQPAEYELGKGPGHMDVGDERSVLDTEEHATQPDGQELAEFKQDMNKFREGFSAWLQTNPNTAKNYLNLWDAFIYWVTKEHAEPKISDIYPFWARLTVDAKHPKGLGFDSMKQYYSKFPQLIKQYTQEHRDELKGNPLVAVVDRLPQFHKSQSAKASFGLGGLKFAEAMGPNGEGEVVIGERCPLCDHTPIYKEDPASGAPNVYFCHACSRGFDQPKEMAITGTVDAAGAKYVGDNDPEKMADKTANWTMKCPHCGGTAAKDAPQENYRCPKCSWNSKDASVKVADAIQPDVAEARAETANPDTVDPDIKQTTEPIEKQAAPTWCPKCQHRMSQGKCTKCGYLHGPYAGKQAEDIDPNYHETDISEEGYCTECGKEHPSIKVSDGKQLCSDCRKKQKNANWRVTAAADDMCEACGQEVANRECAHGILCDTCDEQVHGTVGGPCEIENDTHAAICPECEHPLPHPDQYGCEHEFGDIPGGEGDHGPYGAHARGPCGCKYKSSSDDKEAGIGHEFTDGIRPQTNVQDTGRLEGDTGPQSPSERDPNWRVMGGDPETSSQPWGMGDIVELMGQTYEIGFIKGEDCKLQDPKTHERIPRSQGYASNWIPLKNLKLVQSRPDPEAGRFKQGAGAPPAKPGVGGAAGLTPNQNPNQNVPNKAPVDPNAVPEEGLGPVVPQSGSGDPNDQNQPVKKTVPPDLPYQRLHMESLKAATLHLAGANSDIIKKLEAAAIADKIGWSGKYQEYIIRRGYFYTHGLTEDKLAEAVRRVIPEAQITSARNFWHPWPKDSWFEVRFKVPMKPDDRAKEMGLPSAVPGAAGVDAQGTIVPAQANTGTKVEEKSMATSASSKRAAILEKIKARKTAKNGDKWATLRRVADENAPEAAEALDQLAQAFGELADRVDAFRENLDLVDAPEGASLKTRIAARRSLGTRLKKYAAENPQVLAEAVNELFHSLDDVAAGVEAFAENMGIELTMTPVEEAFVDEGKEELAGNTPAIEEEEPNLEEHEAAGPGSVAWVNDRDESGQPKTPTKMEIPVAQGAAPTA